MQIVIDIPEEDYNIMRHNIAVDNPLCPLSQEEMVSKVANGTPLPKGHGDLIDADAIPKQIELKGFLSQDNAHLVTIYRVKEALNNAPTIISADRSDAE